MKKSSAKILISLLLFTNIHLLANTYTVAASGTEDFQTIQEAVDVAKAGDTVYIKEGTYNERVLFHMSGTDSNPIVFKNYGQDKVTIDGTNINWGESWGGLLDISNVAYITLSGLKVKNSANAGIFLENTEHIVINNVKIHNTYSSGIGIWYSSYIEVENSEISLACNDGGEESMSISGSDHVTIKNNEVHHSGPGTNGGEGIDVKEGSHDVLVQNNHVHHITKRAGLYADAWNKHTYNITFDSNNVHDCSEVGMTIASEQGGLLENVTFSNNIVYRNLDGGMILGGWTAGNAVKHTPVEHISILNNTFYDNHNGDGIYIGNTDAKDIKIYNNIISKNDNSQIKIDASSVAEVDIRHNLIEGQTLKYANIGNIVASAQFVNTAEGDFHLQVSSAAVDGGIVTNILHDYEQNSRPNGGMFDIGAYEYTKENTGGFDFGQCSGSGTFEQQIDAFGGDYEKTVKVGEIPAGIKGLHVELNSDKDVDIRLYGENDDKIVHWPHGILKKSGLETKPYKNVPITYSGYNGTNGQLGHEFIDINGTTPTEMTMKAFGYKAGFATVNYSWTGKEGCENKGHFDQDIPKKDIALVGSIPKDIENLEVNLTSEKDIDIQLYGADGTAIIKWPDGLLKGSGKQTIDHHGMHIEWSGYYGVDGYRGHEYIKLTGKTTEEITMRVYGYEAGSASVDYSWGDAKTNTL